MQARAVIGFLSVLLCASCGEIYADLDVRKQATAEVRLVPPAVFAGTTTWIEVRARLDDGSTASVLSHGFDGRDDVQLADDALDFFPGTCPRQGEVVDADPVQSAAGAAGPPIVDGEHVFCAAIEVGPFETTEDLTVPFTLWNGRETVTGSASLTVDATAGVPR